MELKKTYLTWEKKISAALKGQSALFLRIAIGLIYIWFGTLKLIGISPAEELIYRATHWIGVKDFVYFLGAWEVFIGFCFFRRTTLRLGILLYFLHLPGTFFPLFTNPKDCFTIFPYGLTLEGQYIFKNLVTLGGVLTLIGSLHRNNAKNGN